MLDRWTRSRLGLAFGLIVVTSLALNLFLGWKVVTLRRSIAREERDLQLEIGTPVPPIKAKTMDGQPSTITYIASEMPTVLYFFSPGCESCERNVEAIKKLTDRNRHEYKILGLALSDDGLGQYLRDHDINFPVYTGIGVETTLAYKLGRVPQTTIVSPEGRVIANWFGAYDGKLRSRMESYFQFGD